LYVHDFKGNDRRFASYFLRQLNFGSQNAAGAVPGVNRNHLHAMDVRLPPVSTQRKIADLLSAYDDLIENCERRIRVLDEMTRALYREWFVNFRYPGHEKVPLVDSAFGRIPKGWSAASIRHATAFLSRGIAPAYHEDGPSIVINQKCVRDSRLHLGPARRQSRSIPNDRRVRPGDVLINSTGVGTLGRVAQVLEDQGACTVDTHVTIARPASDVDSDYFGVSLLGLQKTFERKAVGATGQTELNRSAIAETPFLMPTQVQQYAFGHNVRPMRTETLILQQHATTLRQTRDLLLPRLLSGQLSVEDAAA
jgi:type I restriction enzyme S subunit